MKTIRTITQILFLLFFVMVGLGFFNAVFFNYLHVLPSMSKMADMNFGPFFVFAGLMFITLLFGRLYCSFLCPVGFYQDIVLFLAGKFGINGKPIILAGNVLLLFLVVFIIVKIPVYFLIDHFSNMVSFFTYAVNPVLSFMVRPFTNFLYQNYAFVWPVHSFELHWSFVYALGFFIVIGAVGIFYPRAFCNTICPSGLVFRVFSKRSILSIRREGHCLLCKKCDRACPVLCMEDGIIDKDRCIMCFECIGKCPVNGLKLSFRRESEIVNKKRALIKATAYFLVGGSIAHFSRRVMVFGRDEISNVFPPGGCSFNGFMRKCTNCGLCISLCPMKVLRPVRYEGMQRLLPAMDFGRSYCSFECNVCMSICPMNALKYLTLEQKQVTAIGKAKLNNSICVPYKYNLDCGACAEHCPTLAISMIPLGTGVRVPVVDQRYCIGCGICQYSCPVKGEKAINVLPAIVHGVAYHRKSEALGEAKDGFPF